MSDTPLLKVKSDSSRDVVEFYLSESEDGRNVINLVMEYKGEPYYVAFISYVGMELVGGLPEGLFDLDSIGCIDVF